MDKNEDRLWGATAEQWAEDYLLTNGYIIRERNWRPKNSRLEVDIIAQTGEYIVFVEVKARRNPLTDPADAVDEKKIRNLTRAAAIYLKSIPEDFCYRFDIITITAVRSPSDENNRPNDTDLHITSETPADAVKYTPKGITPTLITDEYILDHLPDAFLPPLATK